MKIVYAVFFSCVCSVAAVAQKNMSSRIIPDAPIGNKTTYVEAQRSAGKRFRPCYAVVG